MSAGDTQITIAANLVEDPVLRFTQQGQPVVSFRVALQYRVSGLVCGTPYP